MSTSLLRPRQKEELILLGRLVGVLFNSFDDSFFLLISQSICIPVLDSHAASSFFYFE